MNGPGHDTRSKINRTTPTSSASTRDPAPNRRWCTIANAWPLCVSRTQSRPQDTEYTGFGKTSMVRSSAPVNESHIMQVPALLPEASLLSSGDLSA